MRDDVMRDGLKHGMHGKRVKRARFAAAVLSALSCCAASADILEVDERVVLEKFPSLYSEIKINAGGTLVLTNDGWLSTHDSIPVTGEGTLEIAPLDSWTYKISATSDFSGTLRLDQANAEILLEARSELNGRPKLEVPNGFTYGGSYTFSENAPAPTVRNFTGAGTIKFSSPNDNRVGVLDTLQTEDTVFLGVFKNVTNTVKKATYTTTYTAKTGLLVTGNAGSVHSLTLSGANTSTGPLTVKNYGKVIFTDTGSWAGTVTVGANGYLQIANTAAVNKLVLQDGSTILYKGSAFKPSTITISGNVTVDFAPGFTPTNGARIVESATAVSNIGKFALAPRLPSGWSLVASDDGAICVTGVSEQVESPLETASGVAVGYIDAENAAYITNTVEGITVPAEATSVRIVDNGNVLSYSLASGSTITGATSGEGKDVFVYATDSDGKMMTADGCDISSYFTATVQDGKLEIDIDESKRESIVSFSSAGDGLAIKEGGAPELTATVAPYFWCGVVTATELDGEWSLAESEEAIVQSDKSGQVRLTSIPALKEGETVRFYKIRAAPSKASLRAH